MDNLSFKLLVLGLVISSVSVVICKDAQHFKEQTAIEGSSYKMKCTENHGQLPELNPQHANVNPETKPIVIWSVNGRLPKGPKYKMLTDGLVIRNVSKEDSFANYTCTVLDRFTFTTIQTANIVLKLRQRAGKLLDSKSAYEPITEKKVRTWGIVNQSVKLPCSVSSRPSPSFEWKNQQTAEKIVNSTNVYKIVEDESTSNLTIFLHNGTFFGEYVCTARNNLGESIQQFELVEGYKPKTPFMYPISIGKNRITVRVEPQEIYRTDVTSHKDILPITNYFVQYMEEEKLPNAVHDYSNRVGRFQSNRNKKWITAINTMHSNGVNSYFSKQNQGIFELRNLKGNVTYFVRSAVANAAAVSDFSLAIRVKTEGIENATEPRESNSLEDKLSGRGEYGRSSNYQSGNFSGSISSQMEHNMSMVSTDCQRPQFKKTIIRTTTTTTTIENLNLLENVGKGNDKSSSLVKRNVDEETTVERMFLCDI